MNAQPLKNPSSELVVRTASGWLMLLVTFGCLIAGFASLYLSVRTALPVRLGLPLSILLLIFFAVSCGGYFTLQPNEGRVLLLFGSYQGTVRHSGFHWTNPFNRKLPISLRSRNFQSDKLKVNDKRG